MEDITAVDAPKASLWLVGILGATGLAAARWPHTGGFHAAAGGLLFACVLFAIGREYGRASYRAHPLRWLALVALLVLVVAAYGTGAGLRAGEAGSEGRAHAAAAAFLPQVSWIVILALHVGVAVALVALVAQLLRRSVRRATPVRYPWLVPVGMLAFVAVVGLAVPAPAPVPVIDGAEAARAPWTTRALEPLEESLGVPAAMGVGALALALVALLPLLDRRGSRWARPLVSLTLLGALVAYAGLSLYAGLTPPADHLHAAAEVNR